MTFNYTLDEIVMVAKNACKARAQRRIYAEGASDHKQRNASLGLLTAEEEAKIKDIIQRNRDLCDEQEAKIDAIAGADRNDASKINTIAIMFGIELERSEDN